MFCWPQQCCSSRVGPFDRSLFFQPALTWSVTHLNRLCCSPSHCGCCLQRRAAVQLPAGGAHGAATFHAPEPLDKEEFELGCNHVVESHSARLPPRLSKIEPLMFLSVKSNGNTISRSWHNSTVPELPRFAFSAAQDYAYAPPDVPAGNPYGRPVLRVFRKYTTNLPGQFDEARMSYMPSIFIRTDTRNLILSTQSVSLVVARVPNEAPMATMIVARPTLVSLPNSPICSRVKKK